MKFSVFVFVIACVFISCKKIDTPSPQNSINPPSKPVQLKSTVVSSTHVVLNWNDSSSNEDGFIVERKSASSAFIVVEIGRAHV